jgi:CelD/BcsL family acetyltransferase involved in cellulose biosynthesis
MEEVQAPGEAEPLFPDNLPCDARLARQWRRLEDCGTLPSQTFAFHAALAGTMLPDGVLHTVTVHDGDELAAILPLCRRRGWFSRWHAAGAREIFEPVDALYRDGRSAERLADSLARLSRPVRLDRVPVHSHLLPALRRAMKGRGLVVFRPAVPCPTIALEPGDPDPEGRFNAGRRSDFRRARRRAEGLGAVAFEIHEPTSQSFDALFDEAVAVEQRSWKGDAGTALGSDTVKAAFFREFLFRASREGTCRIAFMRIDGQPVAMQLGVEFRRRYWLFKIGFDRDFSRCSPGNLLMLHALGDAASRGLLGIELLGEVEPWIIDVWTRDALACLRIQTYPFNWRGMATFLAEAAIWGWHRLQPGRWRRCEEA